MLSLSSPACPPLPSVGDGTAALVTATTGAATPFCSSRGLNLIIWARSREA